MEHQDSPRPEVPLAADPAATTRPHAARPFPWPTLIWGMVLIAALLSVLLLLPRTMENIFYAMHRGPERARADAARAALEDLELDQLVSGFQLAANAVGPSVVHIETRRAAGQQRLDEYDALFDRRRFEARSQGSGVIVDETGYILTNYHVVQDAREVLVHLSDGRRRTAEILGADPLTDLAVLRIDADQLTAARWGDSEALEVGSFVWAVGSPFGLDRSVTFGIVSAKGRERLTPNPSQSYLQTDAAVNPGNSGGPLVNVRGEVVGINSFIVGPRYQGVSFAIPSSIARRIYDELVEKGSIERGWLGVGLGDVTPELVDQLNLSEATGALVGQVIHDSPAARAGIKPADVIVTWNGETTADGRSLSQLVAATPIGSEATVVVIRDGQRQTFTVTVGRRPANIR